MSKIKEAVMDCYILKSHSQANDYMTIIKEMDEGFVVRIVRDKDGYEEIINDFIKVVRVDTNDFGQV